MNDSQDNRIIDLYFARDEKAIYETIQKYGRYCTVVAQNILSNAFDAEECVNDTWVRAWNRIPPERPQFLRVWLGRITRNLSIDCLRRRKHRDEELSLDGLLDCIPLREEQADELPALLNAFLESLPALDRKLFVGRFWYLYKVGALAAAYGMTENAVSIRLHRVRTQLKAYLLQRGYTL